MKALGLRTLEIVRPFHTRSTNHSTAQFRLSLSTYVHERNTIIAMLVPYEHLMTSTSSTRVTESFLLH